MKIAVIIALIVAALGLAGGNMVYTASLRSDYSNTVQALTARAEGLGDRLATLESDVADLEARPVPKPFDPSGLQAEIDAASAGLASLKDTVGGVDSRLTDLTSRLDGIDTRLTAAEAGLHRAGLDAAAVYAKVVGAVVRITDGRQIIGSGFIYRADGLVVTANHVIAGLSPIYVIFHDGRTSPATLVGTSVPSDVAVLRVADNPGLAPLPLADATLAVPGDAVMAIGSPGDPDVLLGFRDSVTVGVISQVNRFVTVENNSTANLIQFDAAVNPGNSGGPLFDAAGNVVGIVIARIDATVGDGISWAVDASKVKRVAEEIIRTGQFRYPWLGISITDIDPLTAASLGLSSSSGALVMGTSAGGPAEAAGFRVNDVITAIGGRPVQDLDELVSFLALFYSPGDRVSFDVIRGGNNLALTATVGEHP